MLKGGISDPRSKALMKMLNMIGIGEHAGSGVPDIYSVWENQGWIAQEVIEEYAPDRRILKLAFVNAEVKKATKKSDRKNGETNRTDFKPDVEYKVEETAEWLNVGRTRAIDVFLPD